MRTFWVLLGTCLAVMVVAGMRDRQTRRRAEQAALQQVPEVPGVDADVPPPAYVSAQSPALTRHPDPLRADERSRVTAWQETAARLDLRLADEGLATHLDPPTAVHHDAWILVCPDEVASMRELLPTAERAVHGNHALVVAASSCAAEVIDTLRVNLRAGRLSGCVVIGDASALADLAALTGAREVSRVSLQSGAVDEAALGHADRLVCTGSRTWIGTADDA